ncbi:MAG: protease modulator HflC [Gammaproteobacteria bacterium]|nr:protease modulator HflC [Gammaproteobacteria bacterium]
MTKLHKTVFVVCVAAVLVYMSAFVVDERELVVKFKLGEIVKSDYEPGLYWLWPVINNVKKFDKRIQGLDAPTEQYLTNEKKNLTVDAFVKWRITDVGQFYRTTEKGDKVVANNRLSRIVDDALKNQISQRSVIDVVSGERAEIMNRVRDKVDVEVKGMGITIIDVRIKKLDYSDEISGSVFKQMRQERETEMKRLRSEGREAATKIRAEAERERKQTLAEAYRKSEIIRGEGDAASAAIYAKAYGKNREFYSFYRSLEAYRETFASGQDILILDPDSEFFRYFNNAYGKK